MTGFSKCAKSDSPADRPSVAIQDSAQDCATQIAPESLNQIDEVSTKLTAK